MARIVTTTKNVPTPIQILVTVEILSDGGEIEVTVGVADLTGTVVVYAIVGVADVARMVDVMAAALASTSASELCHQIGIPAKALVEIMEPDVKLKPSLVY